MDNNEFSKYLSKPYAFFIIVFFLTWSFWLPAAYLGYSHRTGVVSLLFLLGGFCGKALPGIFMPYIAYGKKGWIDHWKRVIDYRRIKPSWLVFTLSAFPIFSILGIITAGLINNETASFTTAEGLLSDPIGFVIFILSILIMGPLPEELGWRGYELDRLQSRLSPLLSSIILGILWGTWHFPLFYIVGQYQHDELILGSLRFWLWWTDLIATSIVITWVYDNTQRSTLSAIIIHFMQNFIGEFLNLPVRMEYYRSMWTIVIAIVIAVLWRRSSNYTSTRNHLLIKS